MPGIAAIFCEAPHDALLEELRAMLEAMRHESNYVHRCLSAPELGVVAGMLAHPNSFAARVSSYVHPDGSAVLLSGECFPTRNGQGASVFTDAARFASEVIEGCRRDGARWVRRLNGLFSVLVLDRRDGRALLFNDRYGIERLYTRETEHTTRIASEAKAILRTDPDVRKFDRGSVAQLLKYGSVQGSGTLFCGLQLLPGASFIVARRGRASANDPYFLPSEWESQTQLTAAEFTSGLTETLARIVPAYVAADEPVGLSVTGGLDTRMILASLPSHGIKARCYTFGAPSGATLDERIGRRAAEDCGLEYQSIWLGQDWLENFGEYVDRTVWITDGCAGATTAHEVYLTRLARSISQVRLTGNFGSEILRSVSTLKTWQPPRGFLSESFVDEFDSSSVPVASHPLTRSVFQEVPWHLFGPLSAGRSQTTFRTPYLDNEVVELAYRAPEVARSSSQPALTVVASLRPTLARIPTDRAVVLGGTRLVSGLKRLAAEVAFKLDYLDKEGLPGGLPLADTVLSLLRHTPVLGQHKFLSYRTWFRNEFRALVERVAASAGEVADFVDPRFLDSVAELHASGRRNCLREINAVLTLEAIHRLMLGKTVSLKAGD